MKSPEPKPIPRACARKYVSGTTTVCGRTADSNEFLFGDVEYATKWYRGRVPFLLCDLCYEQHKKTP